MTPLHITILIHYHTKSEDAPNMDAESVKQVHGEFKAWDILKPSHIKGDTRKLILTKRGQALLHLICTTPYPEEVYLDSGGNKIDF